MEFSNSESAPPMSNIHIALQYIEDLNDMGKLEKELLTELLMTNRSGMLTIKVDDKKEIKVGVHLKNKDPEIVAGNIQDALIKAHDMRSRDHTGFKPLVITFEDGVSH